MDETNTTDGGGIGRLRQLATLLATAAAAVYIRAERRVVADLLVYGDRDVTGRLPEADLSAARSVLLVAVLILAAIGAPIAVGPLPAVDNVSADEVVYGDFESGDVTTEGWSDPNNGFAAVTTRSVAGDYSVEAQTSADTSKPELYYTSFNDAPSSLSGYFYYDSYGDYNEVYGLSTRTSGNRVYGLGVGSSGNLRVHDSSSYNTDTGIDIPKNTWYKLSIENIDYSTCTYDVYVYNLDGSVYASSTGYSFENCVNSIDELWLESTTGGHYFADFIATDGASIGQKVSGNIDNTDGGDIDGATVEIRNQTDGSVVQRATTNSSGGYTFDSVSDGEYEIRVSADGYYNKTTTLNVSGSSVTVNLTLFESGSFKREFQLDDAARLTYPPDRSKLRVYRFDRAIEFPLPDGTTFEAGPGTWNEVETTQFNSQAKAYARLENGEPYRIEVVATSGGRSTRWESLGWRADTNEPDPFLISVTESDSSTATATVTSTGTATATPTGSGTVDYGDLTPPTDPFDYDDDGDYFDDPSGGNDTTTAPGGGTGFGPRLAGECLMADGTSGVLVEYWDPAYQTTSLEYNLSAGNNSYAGERTFETPAGYATWCVADTLTNNATDGETGLTGNLTRNGTTTNFSDTLEQSSVFGGPIGGGGGGGEPSTGQRVLGIGLVAGVGYLGLRRFTDFRLSEAASTIVEQLPVGGGS